MPIGGSWYKVLGSMMMLEQDVPEQGQLTGTYQSGVETSGPRRKNAGARTTLPAYTSSEPGIPLELPKKTRAMRGFYHTRGPDSKRMKSVRMAL
jgi:hypothetical protein